MKKGQKYKPLSDEHKRRISESNKNCSEETRIKMSESHKGKKRSEESKKKQSEFVTGKEKPWLKGIPLSIEIKRKISESNSGEKNHFWHKCHSEETKKKMSERRKGSKAWNKGISHSEETKKKISEKHKGKTYEEKFGKEKANEIKKRISEKIKGKKHSDETNKKHRLATIKIINKHIKYGGQITPFYNSNGCKYFEKLMLETNTHIQHAENGGEYYIKELGYWVDGYDKENNIVYEYDEKKHFNLDGTLKEKDIKRQKEIENFLNCEFIIIKV